SLPVGTIRRNSEDSRLLRRVDDKVHILPLGRFLDDSKSKPGPINDVLAVCGVMQPKLDVGSRGHELSRTERTIVLKLCSRLIAKFERIVCAAWRDLFSGVRNFTSTLISDFIGPGRDVVDDIGRMRFERNAYVMGYAAIPREKLHRSDPRIFG